MGQEGAGDDYRQNTASGAGPGGAAARAVSRAYLPGLRPAPPHAAGRGRVLPAHPARDREDAGMGDGSRGASARGRAARAKARGKERGSMTNEPNLTLDEAKAVVATKTAPRVTEDSIKGKIFKVDYFTHDVMTVCIITMCNGFSVVGKSAPASRVNFDAEVGKRYAYDDAFKQLWPLEGYLLRERLHEQQAVTAQVPGASPPA